VTSIFSDLVEQRSDKEALADHVRLTRRQRIEAILNDPACLRVAGSRSGSADTVPQARACTLSASRSMLEWFVSSGWSWASDHRSEDAFRKSHRFHAHSAANHPASAATE
jgi:hypothetical protein